ncbi:hypothetical protein FB45DRAFT_923799 [Roridomyces roridus]|uniref:MYND-type domain-containing protein n=1 Tax=Roridomyces roridus TaxID=1738132 RepID=A0AAD7BLC5_9AGAR|nr:hypothetical protein FB45DRAFT_923799 [Roridomyces roridus]
MICLQPRYELMAKNLETTHRGYLQAEWDRIKGQPGTPRFQVMMTKGTGIGPGKQCSFTACSKPVAEHKGKVCGACRVVIYCSEACQKEMWWEHKNSCAASKRDGELVPGYQAVVEQFPWTKAYDMDDDFHTELILVQHGLLSMDREQVGYWAKGVRGNEQMGTVDALRAPWRVLSEEEGWRLPKDHIPSLVRLHEPDAVCPTFPPTFGESWTSYYEWRGLPIDSIAALLLHWPLAVNACLKELGFVSVAEERRKLTVFYLGARDEITFIPIFGELALLFPNNLVYTSPTRCGAGPVRVFLDSKSEYYRPSRNTSEHPDALVALNAGLGSFRSWMPVIVLAAEFSIPFAVTDYSESCAVQLRLDVME